MLKPLTIAAAALALVTTAAVAAPMDASIDRPHSTISFTAYTKLFDADGHFGKWSVSGKIDHEKFEDSRVNVTIHTKSIDTDNGIRDNHVRDKDFLWVEKYPQATFKTSSIDSKGDNKYVIKGAFTLRGVTKSIKIPVTVTTAPNQKGKRMTRVKGGVRINRFDYGVAFKGGMLLPTVDDNVDIKIDVNFPG